VSKKLLPLLLCLALLLTAPVTALAEEQEEILVLSTAGEFLAFAENCLLDSYSAGLRVQLAADIDLTGTDFQGIPIFRGTLEGRGYTVSGLNITRSGSVTGLFRYLTEEATVRDLKLSGRIGTESSVTVGALAGTSAGRIENCSFTGTVSGSSNVGGLVGINRVTGILEGCSVEGTLAGSHFTGGIAGSNGGVIRDCRSEAAVNAAPAENRVEIGDITLEAITGSENAATVTDIGGIAGTSTGVIRSCQNRGTVGYPHMGYNIGGIAGSQSGLIADCVNYGPVSGRKEVGGIVGHLEPGIRMEFSQDTLQTLKTQMDTMGRLTEEAAAGVQGGMSAIGSQVGALQDHAQNARDALEQLKPTVTPPGEEELLPDVEFPDMDSIQAAQNTLSGSVTGMKNSLGGLLSATQGAAGAMGRGMQALADQMKEINATLDSAGENLGGTLKDVSDEDTPEDITGKVEGCENLGQVLADLNAGGIAGAMAVETDLDPEADVSISGDTSLNFDGLLRAVVRDCANRGSVTAKKQNAGGIAGWMDLGLVKDCLSTGTVEGGSCAGGIAGRSRGYLRDCSVKSRVTGESAVGGIAGQGRTVSDCRSMTVLDAREALGAVLGREESGGEVTGNCYLPVDKDPGGIDGISYEGRAQGLTRSRFLALGGIHAMFRTAEVRFVLEDGTWTAVEVSYGSELKADQIPEVPEKPGYAGSWEGLPEGKVTFDAECRAVYTPFLTVLESSGQRQDGRPILLAEGSFPPETELLLQFSQDLPDQTDSLLWSSGNIQVMTTETVAQTKVLEVLEVTVPQGSGPVTYRYLPGEEAGENTVLLLRTEDGNWKQTPVTRNGSYLVFHAADGKTVLALVETEKGLPGWVLPAVGAVLLLGILLAVTAGKKRKKAGKEPAGEPEAASGPMTEEAFCGEAEPKPEPAGEAEAAAGPVTEEAPCEEAEPVCQK